VIGALITFAVLAFLTWKMLQLRIEMLERRRELKFRRFLEKELPEPPKEVDWHDFEANVREYGH
jgi:hypothetical protein